MSLYRVLGFLVLALAACGQRDSLGTIPGTQERTIKRLGQTMAMNNSGETIELLNSQGTQVHKVACGQADEAEEGTSPD